MDEINRFLKMGSDFRSKSMLCLQDCFNELIGDILPEERHDIVNGLYTDTVDRRRLNKSTKQINFHESSLAQIVHHLTDIDIDDNYCLDPFIQL